MADNDKLARWAELTRIAATWVGGPQAAKLLTMAEEIEAEGGLAAPQTVQAAPPPASSTAPKQVNLPNAPPPPTT